MNSDLYNNKEKEFEKVIKLLKELPKIETPDNFEHNLMVRIQNKNFGTEEKKSFSKWLYIFTPATAVVLSGFLVLFFLGDNLKNHDDLFQFDPPVRQEAGVKKMDTLEIKEFIVDNNSKVSNTDNSVNNAVTVQQKAYQVVVQSNDIVKKTQNDLFIDDSKSVDLDKIMSGENSTPQSKGRIRLVSEGNNYYPFDEFIVKPNKDKSVKSLKARMDSLKNAASKNQNK